MFFVTPGDVPSDVCLQLKRKNERMQPKIALVYIKAYYPFLTAF